MGDNEKRLIVKLLPSLIGSFLFTVLVFIIVFYKCINFSLGTNIVLCVLLVCIFCFLVFMQVICLKETKKYKMEINKDNVEYLKKAVEHFEKEKQK